VGRDKHMQADALVVEGLNLNGLVQGEDNRYQ